MRSQTPYLIVVLETEPIAARNVSNPNIEYRNPKQIPNPQNAYTLNSSKIYNRLANYVTKRRARHSGRVPPLAGEVRNPVNVQWCHLMSGSPLPDRSQGHASRGRCLDPGSRPPPTDLAGMTNGLLNNKSRSTTPILHHSNMTLVDQSPKKDILKVKRW